MHIRLPGHSWVMDPHLGWRWTKCQICKWVRTVTIVPEHDVTEYIRGSELQDWEPPCIPAEDEF